LLSHIIVRSVCSNYIIMKIHYLKRILKNCLKKEDRFLLSEPVLCLGYRLDEEEFCF